MKTGIIGHYARMLELLLLIRSFFLFIVLVQWKTVVSPNPKKGILDVLARAPIISVFTVSRMHKHSDLDLLHN